jgi:hypothetical protein
VERYMKCMENIRLSITRAEALGMKSSAVLVADLKVLLVAAETASLPTRSSLQAGQQGTQDSNSIGD